MSKVYVVRESGSTEAMTRVRCRDEDAELQRILERNHDLLPGDQINPEDPCRWLLIKREMPVPDPNTGTDRWSIDFFFVDQSGIPTFVECKRFADTRSRREIVGQMLEYAANGGHYWTKETVRTLAEQTQVGRGTTLEEAFAVLRPNNDDSLDAYFDRVQENLRQGQLRLIFFLEDSSMELRSVVEFLNRQMDLVWVLLIEARQYSDQGTRVVVPTLFGYTEEARRTKRTIVVQTPTSSRRKWDKDSFFNSARSTLTETDAHALEILYNQCVSLGYEISWGTGQSGSFNVKDPSVCSRSVMTVKPEGKLELNFYWVNGSDNAESGRDRFKDALVQEAGFAIPEDYATKWIIISVLEWVPKVGGLLRALDRFITENRAAAGS